jgi:hypothetical protein
MLHNITAGGWLAMSVIPLSEGRQTTFEDTDKRITGKYRVVDAHVDVYYDLVPT